MSVKENESQYLTFVINDEVYAIPITQVREVLSVPKLTHIPQMPQFMRGVINLRSTVVPIIDLRLKFGMSRTELTAETAIIVIEIPTEDSVSEKEIFRVGIFADAVKKVTEIPSESIEPAPKIGLNFKTSFIFGMGKIDDNFTVILNIREILTDEDIASGGDITEPQEADIANTEL